MHAGVTLQSSAASTLATICLAMGVIMAGGALASAAEASEEECKTKPEAVSPSEFPQPVVRESSGAAS